MTGFQRVRELFLRARDLDGGERAAYLATECGEDAELHEEVLSMLRAEGEAPDFLARPAVPASMIMDSLQGTEPAAERIRKLAEQSNAEQRFVLSGELAEGGMGRILEVFDTDLRRSVAMKVLREREEDGGVPGSGTPGLDSTLLSRFLEEAQVTGQLEHPGVVPVYELGVDSEARVYFTMRRVQGQDLGAVFERVQRGDPRWSVVRCLGVLQRICETMAFAHGKGVVHRDLKPANIMVGDYGEVYVMDWGLARVRGRSEHPDVAPALREAGTGVDPSPVATDRTSSDSDRGSALLTMDGTVIGTPHYMPPEQALGRVDEIDERSDVYAIGAMLYHLLAGRMPYARPGQRRSAHAVVEEVRAGPPRPLQRLAPEAAPDLVAICRQAMARDRADRYASAEELAADIRRHFEHLPISARPLTRGYRMRKYVRRNRTQVTLLGVFFAAAVISTFFGVVAARNAGLAERTAARASVMAASLADDSGDAAASGLLQAVPGHLRGWEWRHLSSRLEPPLSEAGFRVDLLDDGQTLLTCTNASPQIEASWIDVDSGHVSRSEVLGLEVGLIDVAALPGGDELVLLVSLEKSVAGVVLTRVFGIWDVDRQAFSARHSVDSRMIRLLEDESGHQVVFSDGLGVSIADPRTGGTLVRHELAGINMLQQASGGQIVAGADDGRVFVLDRSTLETRLELPRASEDWPMSGAVSSDLRYVGVSDRNGDVFLWDLAPSPPVRKVLWTAHGGNTMLRLSPDETRLVALASDARIRVWDVATGRLQQTLTGHVGRPIDLVFLPDGQRFVTTDTENVVRGWTLGDGPFVLDDHSSYVYAVAPALAGGLVATGGWDGYYGEPGCLRLWDGSTGAPVASLGEPGQLVECLAALPDGKGLVAAFTTIGSAVRSTLVHLDLGLGRRRTLGTRESLVSGLSVSPDGRRVGWPEVDLAIRDTHAVVMNLADGRVVHERAIPALAWAGPHPKALTWSPDGRLLAVSSSRRIELWDAASYAPVGSWEAHDQLVTSLSFSADSRRLVSASMDRTVRVWSVDDGRRLGDLAAHSRGVLTACFSPDGERLVSGGYDGIVRVWDGAVYEPVAELRGHASYVYDLAWSDDGETLYSASGDGSVREWGTTTVSDRHAARRERSAILERVEAEVLRLPPSEAGLAEVLGPRAGWSPRERDVAWQVLLAERLAGASEER